jgi:PAS domain S-box-containing protein
MTADSAKVQSKVIVPGLHDCDNVIYTKNHPWLGAFRIVVVYAVFAALWILLSDRAIGLLFIDADALIRASMVKGWLFVAFTSLLLFILVRRLVGQLASAHRRELEREREQRQAPAMLAALAENTDDAIFIKDPEGRYLMLNRAASRFIGKPVEDVLGKDDSALFPARQAEMLLATGRRVLETGMIETNEEVVSTPAGERVFLATKGPLRDAAGRLLGIFGISRDITERKQIEEAVRANNERLKKVIDNDMVGVMFWDMTEGRLIDANEYFLRLVGFSRREMDAGELTWQRLTPTEYVPLSVSEMDKLAKTGRIGPYQKEYLCKNGSRQWLLFAGSLIEDNLCVEFCVDISDLKASENQLKARNAELERFNRAATERELRMIALKREVNTMASELGRPMPYDLSFAEEPRGKSAP